MEVDFLVLACRNHIRSKGVVLWQDWDVSKEDGLREASRWLAQTIREVIGETNA